MSGGKPPYFIDKKGEVNELRALLRNHSLMRVASKKRDIIKKVIAYMTLGIDVSRLFSDMMLLANTKDMVVKKMVFQFLCKYGLENSDLAIMCVNTLRQDCQNEDPMVRGLALRSLCALRVVDLVQYMLEPLEAALRDKSPYVRKTAAMAVAKIYHISAEHVADLTDTLYDMIRDRSPMVAANAVVALSEIMREQGGLAIDQKMVHHILNRIKSFNEWGQSIMLNLVASYKPLSQKEIFQVMNLLDGAKTSCLKMANSSVVIATSKIFLKYAGLVNAGIAKQIYQRLKTPFLTLLSNPVPESNYCILCHIKILVERCPGLFDADFKKFFARYNEPTHIKYVKLDILPQLANKSNVLEILGELSEYASDIDSELARRAIGAIANIGVRLPPFVNQVIDQLLQFGELNSFVCCETVIVIKDILRKYPRCASKVVPKIAELFKNIDKASGKAAVIWMIGEYGQLVEDGPYILEGLIDDFANEKARVVRLELLTATVKLFFKRAPECQKMLGQVLQAAIDEESDTDIHDRALLFYRLLQEDSAKAKAIINCPKGAVQNFLDEMDKETKEAIFKEFNSLSVLYRKPARLFINKEHQLTIQHEEPEEEDEPEPEPVAAPAPASGGLDDFLGGGAPAPAPAPAPASGGGDIFDDLFGGGGGAAPAPAAPKLAFSKTVVNKATFQGHWKKTAVSGKINLSIPAAKVAQVSSLLAAGGVITMAKGNMGNAFKFFMHATETSPSKALHLIMLLVAKNGTVQGTVKSSGGSKQEFIKHVQSLLS